MRKPIGLIGIALAAFGGMAMAQNWPEKPVRIVVPSAPGGGTDGYARLISIALTEALKQPFVIDNRPGADGNIGTDLVAKSAPDGYTILVSAIPAMVINPFLYKKLPYNVETDFVPVAPGVNGVWAIVVHPSVAVKTLADLIAIGKNAPGTLAYGSPGVAGSSYMVVRMLEESTGAKFLQIPYKGAGPANQGILSGDIQFLKTDVISVLSNIRAGKVRALAVNQVTDLLPGIPTLADAGYKDADLSSAFMVVAPRGTPSAVVQRLNAEINKAMKMPANAKRLHDQGQIPIFETPEQFAESLKKSRAIWGAFIRRNSIVVEQ
jgi:tripartite-type tricarboxylate transporter receptor subunit TctC